MADFKNQFANFGKKPSANNQGTPDAIVKTNDTPPKVSLADFKFKFNAPRGNTQAKAEAKPATVSLKNLQLNLVDKKAEPTEADVRKANSWVNTVEKRGSQLNPVIVNARKWAEIASRNVPGMWYGYKNRYGIIVECLSYDPQKLEFVLRDGTRRKDYEAYEKINADDVKKTHARIERDKLGDDQIAAIDLLLHNQYANLIGPAGTGKTTVVEFVIDDLDSNGAIGTHTLMDQIPPWRKVENPDRQLKSVAFTAFTGQAVEQLSLRLPEELRTTCMTTHRLLGFYPEDMETRTFIPYFGEHCKLPYDVVIIDEGGFMPFRLFRQLFAALKPGCRIIVLGDINQLATVGDIGLLPISMMKWPTAELVEVRRSVGPIVEAAHKILRGQMPDAVPGIVDTLALKDNIEDAAKQVVGYGKEMGIMRTLVARNMFDPHADMIISPQNVGPLGQTAINDHLAPYFCGDNERSVIDAGRSQPNFAVSDRVTSLSNDYSIVVDDYDNTLTNGMSGFVTRIAHNPDYNGKLFTQRTANVDFSLDDMEIGEIALAGRDTDKLTPEEEEVLAEQSKRLYASHIVTVRFRQKEVTFRTAGQFNNLALGYCRTGHKMQGSEAPRVAVIAHHRHMKLLSREWLYSTATRPRHRLFLIMSATAMRACLKRQALPGMTSQEKVRNLQEKLGIKLGNFPLPTPKAVAPNYRP